MTILVVEIYTTRFCPYCNAARTLLRRRGIVYREIDIAGNWERRDEMIRRAKGCATLPQVFLGDSHIGGMSELTALDASGRLDEILSRLSAYQKPFDSSAECGQSDDPKVRARE